MARTDHMRHQRRRTANLLRGATLCIALAVPAPGWADGPNYAAGFAWRGLVETDLKFSEFYETDHTLMARFMLQYPRGYVAPIFAVAGSGKFVLAKANETPTLVVELGGTVAAFSKNRVDGGWHHVALVRRGAAFSLFLDGKPICPDQGPCSIAGGPETPVGTLRLGHQGSRVTFDGHEGQFYGLIDDVAIFKRALAPPEIAAIARAPRLSGQEQDLLAGYAFGPPSPGAPLPAALSRAVRLAGLTKYADPEVKPARAIRVSDNRDSVADLRAMTAALTPQHQAVLELPVPRGEAWLVDQGWGGKISHYGRAEFAWDFTLAGHPAIASRGQPALAAAAGKVVETRNDRDSCQGYPASYVMIEQAPEEIGAYLHFIKGSVEVKPGETVSTGRELAKIGDTGNTGCGLYHLHFALHTKPESQAGNLVTFPAAFSNYEVSTDHGRSWRRVPRGVPLEGEWIRH
jgi:murein DD-endopeptidase MepM/ murein hydrolase activator NlpD